VELSEEGILELDAAGSITYANRRMTTMLGQAPGALHRSSAVVSDVPGLERRHAELEDTRRHLEEAQRLARLGHWWDARGATVLTGTVQDNTARKQAELALRESEQRLQRVLAATNDGWWDHDPRTDETFHSDRSYAIHGPTREQVEESPTL